MKCDEAGEFVSALCDGETIPRPAAEHIGECVVCRGLLNEYSGIGLELRRVASLELPNAAPPGAWKESTRVVPSWWRKGLETMQIPKFVFATLLMIIAGLGSGLVIVRARTLTPDGVLLLKAKFSNGEGLNCALSLGDEKFQHCDSMSSDHTYGFRLLAKDNDRVQIGLRMGLAADVGSLTRENVDKLPEKQYWFRPGDKLEIDVPGAGPMVITGELMDHMPALIANDPSQQIDPQKDELRFVSPVLLRGKTVVFDFQGVSAITDRKQGEIQFYAPGEGLFHISLSPLSGAAEGRIATSRVSFVLEGQSYLFLLAAPVARGEHIWILRDTSFQPSGELRRGFMKSMEQSHLLARP